MARLVCLSLAAVAGALVGSRSRLPAPAARSSRATTVMKDFAKPNVEDTIPYREASTLSDRFPNELYAPAPQKKKVAIIGGGLSGLSCAKYLSDAGHEPTVYEARDVLGGKVSAWQDADGDWIETGLHIFFGAYPNMMRLFYELGIEDRLQWKVHKMVFAMQELPGEFTTFDFIPGIPAPFNFGLAILLNQKMLTLGEKLQTAPPLLPMLIEGQDFINAQDELSVLDFMRKYGMPDRINDEVFISMAKALDFIDPGQAVDDRRLDGHEPLPQRGQRPPDGVPRRQPARPALRAHGRVRREEGRQGRHGAPLDRIEVDAAGNVDKLVLRSGEEVVADEYVSAMPVDVLKRMVPEAWSTMPYFKQLDELEGIPVINLHLWFDEKLTTIDHLCFSRRRSCPSRGHVHDL
ncbi:oxidoreductase [Aureococcus anophagefferens]|nr:oxidoreductase [Aureococcus anophagefferens]